MSIQRPRLKQQAREIVRTARPKVLYASAMFVALSALVSFLSSRLTGISLDAVSQYMSYLQEGSTDTALSYIASQSPSPAAQLIDSALQIVMMIVGVGFTVFLFNTERRTGAVYGNLLDGFGPYFRLVLLEFVAAVFAALWSLLLVVPGIVAAYRYSMAKYVMLDHPDYSLMECIRESKRMTKGHKWELFMLDLSFLGYFLLSMLPLIGLVAQVWYMPYRELSFLLAYEGLRTPDAQWVPVE